jgi:hypothetical protein
MCLSVCSGENESFIELMGLAMTSTYYLEAHPYCVLCNFVLK